MQAYCAACGEKRPDREDWKLQHIASETLSELTNVEQSKLYGDDWLAAGVKAAAVFIVYFAISTSFIAAALLLAISRARAAG